MRFTPLILAAILAACGAPQPPVVASDVEVTQPTPGRNMSAAYFVLTNHTDTDLHITRATSPQFGSVEIHETTITDGIARMRRMDQLVVPAHGTVTLRRGGKHLMLMRPRELGDSVSLQLISDDTPVLTIDYTFPGDAG